MEHPNRKTDPDCTTPSALDLALDIKIAAETYADVVTHLQALGEHYECSVGQLLSDIDQIYQRVSEKYAKLRDIIKET